MNKYRKKPVQRNYRTAAPRRGARITEGGNFHPGKTLTLTAPRRFAFDMDAYKSALRGAEDVDFTRRVRLYDLYNDTLLDPHLFSVTQKRKSGVLGRPIEFRRDGVPDEGVNEQISSPWFMRFMEDALDAQLWGFSLLQFYLNEQGWIDYYCVPRKHVDPVTQTIRHRQEDITGEPFDSYAGLLLIRGKEPMGVLARTAPYVLYKRGTMNDWAEYCELFGMPIRKYTYDSTDPDSVNAVMDAAASQGGANTFFCPSESNLEFIESGNKTGSNELYATFVDRCNAEMSKAVLGNTLTTEASDTGTQALGTVHRKEEQGLVDQDAQFVLNLLNYDMTDLFASLGVNTAGGQFVFVEEEDPTAQAARVALLKDAVTTFRLPLDDDYLYEQLKMEKPSNYDRLKAEQEARRTEEQQAALAAATDNARTDKPGNTGTSKQNEPPQNRGRRFFGHAPQSDGALDW